MIRQEKENIHWLEFELFQECPHLKHAVFLRSGNFDLSSKKNRDTVCTLLDIPCCVSPRQCHGTEIREVDSSDMSRVLECDGLTTQEKDLGLMIYHADCQATIIYDPIHHAVMNVHAGWRGMVEGIYRQAVRKMGDKYSSRPEDLLVGISPSLGPDAAEFVHYRQEFPESFWPYQMKPDYFDLWQIARWQFEEEGVLSHHLQVAEICTYSHPEDFFSYRRDHSTERHGTVAAL